MDSNKEAVNSIDDLEHLKKLHDEGTLSEEEFAAAKAKLLGIDSAKNSASTLSQTKTRRNAAIYLGLFIILLIIAEMNANRKTTSSNPDFDRSMDSLSKFYSATSTSDNSSRVVSESHSSSTNNNENASSSRFEQEVKEWKILRNSKSNKNNLPVSEWHLKCKGVYDDHVVCIFDSENLFLSTQVAAFDIGWVVLKNQTEAVHENDILVVSGKFGGVSEDGKVIIYVTKLKNEGVK